VTHQKHYLSEERERESVSAMVPHISSENTKPKQQWVKKLKPLF